MKRLFAAAVLSVLGFSSTANASQYTFETIDFPGADSTSGEGINDKGDIVGEYKQFQAVDSVIPVVHGFLYSGDQFSTINHPAAPQDTILTDLSNHGIIVGQYGDIPFSTFTGFVYDGKDFTNIVPPFERAIGSATLGINDAAHIAGAYDIGGADSAGFVFDGYDFIRIDRGFETSLHDINNLDQFVGSFTVDPGPQQNSGFFFDGNDFIEINFPGAFSTVPLALNDKGEIAGFYFESEDQSSALGFIFDGQYHTINFPGADSTTIGGINNAGQFVGAYLTGERFNGDFINHGFLATPVRGAAVPEPSTMILLGLSIAGIFAAHRYSRKNIGTRLA